MIGAIVGDIVGSLVAAVDPEFAVEMGLIPSLQDLLEER